MTAARPLAANPKKWGTEKEFSEISGIPQGTLRNWRHRDKKAGRDSAPPGYPIYRRWGGDLVRYYIGDLTIP